MRLQLPVSGRPPLTAPPPRRRARARTASSICGTYGVPRLHRLVELARRHAHADVQRRARCCSRSRGRRASAGRSCRRRGRRRRAARPRARPRRRRARCAAAACRAPAVDERPLSFSARRQVGTRRLQRRDDAEDDARAAPRSRSRRRARAGRCRSSATRGTSAGSQARMTCDAAVREQDADRGAGEREHERLRPAGRGRAASGWRRARRGCPSRGSGRWRARASGSRRWRRRSAAPAPTAPSSISIHGAHAADEVVVQRDDARAPARAPLRVLLVERRRDAVHLLVRPAPSMTPSFRRPITVQL